MSLEAKNLTLSYASTSSRRGKTEIDVLVDANLVVERGQILALQGPNGAGKSTLMKALARHLKPKHGQVLLDGKNIWDLPVQHFARKIAYVPQTLSAPPAMTVRELVSLGRSPHQKIFQLSATANDQAIVDEALKHCGVDMLRDKLLSELSGGERQRTVIAMALSQGPDYLLLDEPTASLDFRYQLELVELLDSLRAKGVGIALILHDLNIAARLADRIALIASSRIIAQGAIEDVFCRETLRSVFAVDIEVYSSNSGGREVYLPARLK
ncbi:MAG: ABC transporter ATP-binding protein [Cyanobacteria bacterium REEB67]|nr:ABC transporter ATP-binding protein [Cyanobacteria bacterium REEB67]